MPRCFRPTPVSESVRLDRHGAVGVITLDRPEKRNAVGAALRAVLVEVLEEVEADDGLRAVVLTGAGGHFSAGGDLSDLPSGSALAIQERMRLGHVPLLRIAASPKPFVAAAEGIAYGIGLAYVLACDHVLATPATRFCAPFVRVGLMPDGGMLWTLPRRVGPARARDMMLGGEPVDGEEALRIGLADRLVPAGEALAEAVRRAEVYAKAAPAALAATRSALRHADASLTAVLDLETAMQTILLGTADHAEGKAAFFERRPPVFRNG